LRHSLPKRRTLGPDSPSGTSGQLLVVCIAGFVTWSGFGAILPYLPIFLREQAHSPLWLLGVIASAYYVGTLAFSALFGRASDVVGRKPLMVGGLVLFAVSTLLFITTTHAAWFAVFRLLEGVGAAAVTPASQAFVADISTDSTRSRSYGWLTSAQYGGLILGPALAPPLYALGGGQGKWAFYAIFLFGSALSAATALLVAVMVKEPVHGITPKGLREPRPPIRNLISGPVAAFVVIAATSNYAMGAFEVLWSLWLHSLGGSLAFISATWIVFSVPMLLSFVGGAVADRGNRFALMLTGYVVAACAWIVYGTTHNLWLFIAVNALEGLAFAWSYPAKQAFLVQVSPPRWIGAVQGLEGSSALLAALVGTLLSPVLYGLIGGWAISLGGVIALIGLAVEAPVLHREWQRIRAPGAPAGESQPET
jgi:DHA1 family multidrug resistance protein-like MFS transporter